MLIETVSLWLLAVQSYFDWREYDVPLALPFYTMGLAVGYLADPLRPLIVLAVTVWALGVGPTALALSGLLHPLAFFLTPLAYQVRRGRMGMGDLLLVGGIGAAFGTPALVAAVAGMEVWRRWWRRNEGSRLIPMVPGMTLGFLVWLCLAQLARQAVAAGG